MCIVAPEKGVYLSNDSLHSRSNTPSVTYLIRVLGDASVSNRTEYPTVSPHLTCISCATLWAMVTAATLLGCVTTMLVFGMEQCMYCGT